MYIVDDVSENDSLFYANSLLSTVLQSNGKENLELIGLALSQRHAFRVDQSSVTLNSNPWNYYGSHQTCLIVSTPYRR